MNNRLIRSAVTAAVLTAGILHVVIGGLMLVVPAWFYENIGTFPPFNRHYTGDNGAYQLPLGLALLWAARNPVGARLLVAAAAGGNLIHSLNHAYDDLLLGVFPSWQTLALLVYSIGLALAIIPLYRASNTQKTTSRRVVSTGS